MDSRDAGFPFITTLLSVGPTPRRALRIAQHTDDSTGRRLRRGFVERLAGFREELADSGELDLVTALNGKGSAARGQPLHRGATSLRKIAPVGS